MIHKVFAIYDAKAEFYARPFYEVSIGQALRAFADACQNAEHAFCKHAEDFTLWQIGTYDDGDAKHTSFEHLVPLGKAMDFRTSILAEVPKQDLALGAL